MRHMICSFERRRFVVATLSKLVRLSYRSRIQSVIPPAFVPLLAADNDVLPLPGPPELAPDADVDGAHEDERDAETVRAYQLLQMVRAPPPICTHSLHACAGFFHVLVVDSAGTRRSRPSGCCPVRQFANVTTKTYRSTLLNAASIRSWSSWWLDESCALQIAAIVSHSQKKAGLGVVWTCAGRCGTRW